ncbi:hypothetical protein [Polyangium jinanense]|uniref:Uncharacterized protein n=1 Tax=Polyangium jinanense TaxID=2829994 RepID=A0A9X3X0K2_9BACT|nr:hypothetical protein [Polyangium jinanense]MDC3955238.1 hypothetical protein [Polyangium jinanense]MDC3981539.1 hypothetical protein [Polyangium jinanense]
MKVEYWLAGALLCTQAACSSDGNAGRAWLEDGLAAAVPWANGAVPLRNTDGSLVSPYEPVFPPIGAGTPDPGSRPVDCSGLSGIELSPFWIETFEADPSLPNSVGVGEGWSAYDDETYGAFRVPGDAAWYPGLFGRYKEKWGLAADRITNGPSCDGQPNGWALHFRGGRFNYFGAGLEHPLAAIVACPSGSDLCPQPPDPGATLDPVGLPLTRPDGHDFEQPEPHRYWDLSRYDGVTFWARRGPDSQPGVLVALHDKHTSDALNREHQTFCRRIKACRPACQNGSPCTPENPDAPVPTHRCFDPAVGMAPIAEPALLEELYPVCGPSACRSPEYYYDRDLDGTECKPYDFSGAQAGYYCYGSVAPAAEQERCGDGWVASIRLTTDWQLFVIPFSEFRQVGFAKHAPFLDLRSINMLALQLPVGFADVYIDNVTFYRRR